MAVGPETVPSVVHPVAGVRIGVAEAGIRKKNRRDLVLFELAQGSTVAATFTRNRFCAAPVLVAREHLATAMPRLLLVNTGCANAGTGAQGLEDARSSCVALAGLAQLESAEVLPFSTGVIGERLPMDRLVAGLPLALAALTGDAWLDAAHGIMTTDTRPKVASIRITVDGKPVTITGIAKGAGMICPNMATMLSFVATDAAVDAADLQDWLSASVNRSFNRITIDGDTSTNDACVLAATGGAGVKLVAQGADTDAFRAALDDVMAQLAQAIVRDGEGATKFVTVAVGGGRDTAECLAVAYTIAHSPLVKTALFASDPNWGRILACVGRAGLDNLDVSCVDIFLDDVCIVRDGGAAPDYTETRGAVVMAQEEILIRVELARGAARDRVWTTDLSFDYVKINAEYRT
ncbi:MAG: bifunctional glutamate N-acetyltransferase/amino-acid acetyltransferase ArgJ [Gammaproteobacteria bacterium]